MGKAGRLAPTSHGGQGEHASMRSDCGGVSDVSRNTSAATLYLRYLSFLTFAVFLSNTRCFLVQYYLKVVLYYHRKQ